MWTGWDSSPSLTKLSRPQSYRSPVSRSCATKRSPGGEAQGFLVQVYPGVTGGVRIEIGDDDDDVIAEPHRPTLGVHEERAVVRGVKVQVPKPAQRGVGTSDGVEGGEVRCDTFPLARPAGFVVRPAAVFVLVLLVVQLLFGAGAGRILDEFVSGVDAGEGAQNACGGFVRLLGTRVAMLPFYLRR